MEYGYGPAQLRCISFQRVVAIRAVSDVAESMNDESRRRQF